jgi:hypothetical protein
VDGHGKLVVTPAAFPSCRKPSHTHWQLRGRRPTSRSMRSGWADAVVLDPEGSNGRAVRCSISFFGAGGTNAARCRRDHALRGGYRPRRGTRKRPALLTPHPVEFARLAGRTSSMFSRRASGGDGYPTTLSAVVLLKGVPTIITSPEGRRLVSASRTPALATGGSETSERDCRDVARSVGLLS